MVSPKGNSSGDPGVENATSCGKGATDMCYVSGPLQVYDYRLGVVPTKGKVQGVMLYHTRKRFVLASFTRVQSPKCRGKSIE